MVGGDLFFPVSRTVTISDIFGYRCSNGVTTNLSGPSLGSAFCWGKLTRSTETIRSPSFTSYLLSHPRKKRMPRLHSPSKSSLDCLGHTSELIIVLNTVGYANWPVCRQVLTFGILTGVNYTDWKWFRVVTHRLREEKSCYGHGVCGKRERDRKKEREGERESTEKKNNIRAK